MFYRVCYSMKLKIWECHSMDRTQWKREFSVRFCKRENELKWLFCELYHNDLQAYDYFVSMLYRNWEERPESLAPPDNGVQ